MEKMSDKYTRTPGGEKTAKSGQKWAREELEQVYYIYAQCREQLHERNPVIQALARKIGRSIRSVEAQLLMFRSLEKADQGEGYSRNRMNKLCEEIWKEKKWEMMIAEEPTRAS